MEMKEMLYSCAVAQTKNVDEEAGLLVYYVKSTSGGDHSEGVEAIHGLRQSSFYAALVLCNGFEAFYHQGLQAAEALCDLQDVREGSRTFGLWPLTKEQNLDETYFPDYNWADFIGKNLQDIVQFSKCPLPEGLKAKLLTAIRNAAICSIRRNVGLDYSNIAVMSCLTIICAGEILQDAEIFQNGKARLQRLCAYMRFNGSYSEYNSSTYALTVLGDVNRMLYAIHDPECVAMAKELNFYVWKMIGAHYNSCLKQLSPPQARAYRDLEDGSVSYMVWCGTRGKYGAPMTEKLFNPELEYMLELICPGLTCPEEALPYFEGEEKFLADTYYKKNDLRTEGEDYTIVRDPDNPDMTAFTLRTPGFSMGVFSLCDTWVQRRNCMVVWDQEKPKCFRLRGIVCDYDFCGGVLYARQKENQILGQLGLVTDRGRVHYIIDKEKNGIYETDTLHFRFDLGGACEDLTIRQEGKDFFVEDGELTIKLHIEKWLYDGKDAPVYVSADGKSVILEGYQGEKTMLDTNILAETCGVFTMTVEDPTHKAVEAPLSWELVNGKLSSRWGALVVESPAKPVTYREALGLKA